MILRFVFRPVLGAVFLAVPLSGCIVRTAADVATLPVRAGAQVVDWSTTSQDEADRNRGRAMRKQEKKDRKARKEECRRAERTDC